MAKELYSSGTVRGFAARGRARRSRDRVVPRLASKSADANPGHRRAEFPWRFSMKRVLETPRLALREFVPADADALARVISDPVAMRYFPLRFNRAAVRSEERRVGKECR